jgi:hypothetical protein
MASAKRTSVICVFRALTEVQFWHKMASSERLLVSAHFITYYYRHTLVSHPTKSNKYTALQNENSVSCLVITAQTQREIEKKERRNNALWWEQQ